MNTTFRALLVAALLTGPAAAYGQAQETAPNTAPIEFTDRQLPAARPRPRREPEVPALPVQQVKPTDPAGGEPGAEGEVVPNVALELTGKVRFGGLRADLALPPDWRYLPDQAAANYLRARGFKLRPKLAGVIVPPALDDTEPDWVIQVYAHAIGFIDDRGFQPDSATLLKASQATVGEYLGSVGAAGAMELDSWGLAPRYDADRSILRWTDRLRYSGRTDLYMDCYAVVLGRQGAFELLAEYVRDVEWGAAEDAVAQMADAIRFDPGETHAHGRLGAAPAPMDLRAFLLLRFYPDRNVGLANYQPPLPPWWQRLWGQLQATLRSWFGA